MKKFIALDVDGVLNTDNTKELTPNSWIGIEDKFVERLAFIVKATKAELILTSSWRYEILNETEEGLYLTEKLNKYNLHISYINSDDISNRFECLAKNLNENYEDYKCAILDDEYFDYFSLKDTKNFYFIHTDCLEALSEEETKEAVAYLNK
jgi:hypothetical protein